MEESEERTSPSTAEANHFTAGETLHSPHLPGGSALFQEVMVDFNPSPEPTSPSVSPILARRRHSVGTKHVDIAVHQADCDPSRKVKGQQILHGLCHCYIVERGEVTGLADFRCNHPHPKHASPVVSPRAQRKTSTAASPDGALGLQQKRDGQRRTSISIISSSSSNTQHTTQHARLLADDFRGRALSDASALKRPGISASLATPGSGCAQSQSSSSGIRHRRHSAWSRSSADNATSGQRTPQRSLSFRHVGSDRSSSIWRTVGRSESSLRATPDELAQATAQPSAAEQEEELSRLTAVCRRKLSSHAVPSEELHYLYDQFLPHTSPGARRAEMTHMD